MAVINKLTVAFTMLFICANIVSAQNRVSFNDYGIYLVQNGVIKEIQQKYKYDDSINLTFFWENYLVLEGYALVSYIYNIETGSMSDSIDFSTLIKLERGNNLIAYIRIIYDYWIYEFEPDTLKLISKVKLKGDPFPDSQRSSYLYDFFEENNHAQETEKEKINDRLYRYRGANFYLDVHYGPAIDLSGKYFGPFVRGGKKNVFIVIMQRVEAYSR